MGREVKGMYLEEVSTTCGSGWVDDEHAIFYQFHIPQVDPPATAGGTDLTQPRSVTFEATP